MRVLISNKGNKETVNFKQRQQRECYIKQKQQKKVLTSKKGNKETVNFKQRQQKDC